MRGQESCNKLSVCIHTRKLLITPVTSHGEQEVVMSITLHNYISSNSMYCTVCTDHVTHLRTSESAGRTVIMTQLYNWTDSENDCTLHPFRHVFVCVYSQVSLPVALHNVHQIRTTSCPQCCYYCYCYIEQVLDLSLVG